MEEIIDQHSRHSTLRERIVEHVFIGDTLRRLWQRGITDVKVLRSEFDAGGYDLVLGCQKVVRHIQLKTMKVGGKANAVKVSVKLMEKPSGCVIWIVVDAALNLDSYLWFGESPGLPLANISDFKVAKHTKGDASGRKGDRPGYRLITRNRFEKVGTLDALLVKLFGSCPEA
jgi:hypothetical protein